MKKSKKFRTDYLFASPSFLTGAGSVFNLSGNYYSFNYSKNDSDADTKALLSDWGVIGEDIENAQFEFKNSQMSIEM